MDTDWKEVMELAKKYPSLKQGLSEILCEGPPESGDKLTMEQFNAQRDGAMVQRRASIGKSVPLILVFLRPWIKPDMKPTVSEFRYPNGDIYIGEFFQLSPNFIIPHGWGGKYCTTQYYEGEWRDGLKHGSGILNSVPGEVYEGSWVENKRHGYGVLTQINGTKYKGGWYRDKRSGYGKENAMDAMYKGGFLNDQMHGHGILKQNLGRDSDEVNPEVKGELRFDGGWRNGTAQGYGVTEVGSDRFVGSYCDGVLKLQY